MKRIIILLILLIFVLAFSSCQSVVDTDSQTETEAQTETETSTDTEAQTETETSTDTETTTETNTETETDTETNADTETSTETESTTETETSTETSTETEVEEIVLAKLTVDEAVSITGKISFEIEINGLSGEYILLFADKEKKELSYYSDISRGKVDGENSTVKIEGLVVPASCKYLLFAIEENDYFLEIPSEYLISKQDGYRFGALSDVHYNKGNYFNFALDFLDNQGVDFVGVAGDLSNDGELKYFDKFNEAIKNRQYKVYTVSGNHDAEAVENGAWQENVNKGILDDKEVTSIAPNGIDFVYKPEKMGGDVFVFLCQTHWNYPSTANPESYTILEKSQLEWLRLVLEENKENTVFLFFHTFLTSADGNETDAVGNMQNPAGYEYPLSYTYGTADEMEFRALLKEYKNVIYFSGHSHWMFELEKYNENLNFSNFDGEYGYMVHVPSVCEPRWIGENDEKRTSMTGKASEGWIVDVYDEAIVFTPVDFIKEVYYTEYMKIIPLK